MATITLPITLVPRVDAAALHRALQEAQRLASQGGAGNVRLIDASDVQRQAAAGIGALKPLRTELGAIADEVGRARDAMGRFTSITQEAGESGSRLGKAFQFNQVTQAVQQVSAVLQELSQPFVALDTATAQMRALGDEAAKMAPRLREAAIVMSRELPVSAAELQQAMTDALASGVEGGEEGLKGFADTAAKLAVGGGSSIGDATSVLAGQLNAYGLSAENAGRVSDVLFNTVNAGVTTIQELSSTLANVVPTAAGAGVELDQVGAALALMTQKGIPTAQSTTKLNQLLIELQKPASTLAPILREAGVTLASLASDDIVTTLEKIKLSLSATGQSAVQVFGSSEAAAAFQSLAGDLDGFRKALSDVSGTTGSTENAFQQMSQSIQVQSSGMLSAVQSFVVQGLDQVGPAVLGIVTAGTQIAPVVTSLAGLKDLLPIDAAGKFASSLASKILPALEALGVVRIKNAVVAGADAAAEISDTAAKVTNTVATQGQTVAQYGLNAAFLASPLGVITALAAAGGIAYALLSSSTKDLEEATADASAAMESFRTASLQEAQARKQAETLRGLSKEYEQLQLAQTGLALVGGPTAAVQAQLADVSGRMAQAVPEATEAVDGLTAAGIPLSGIYQQNTTVFEDFIEATVRGAQLAKTEALQQLTEEAAVLGASLRATLADQVALRSEAAALQAQVADGNADVAANPLLGGAFGTVRDELRDITADIAEVNKKFQESAPEIQKIIDGLQAEGFSVDEIKQKLAGTELTLEDIDAILVRTQNTFQRGLLPPSEALAAAMQSLNEDQRRAVEAASILGKRYQDAQGTVDALNAKLADAKLGGQDDLARDLERQISDAQKVADEARIALETILDDQQLKKGLQALEAEGLGKDIAPITVQAKVIADDKAFKDVQDSAGRLIHQVTEAQKEQTAATTDAQRALVDPQVEQAQQLLLENFQRQAEQIQANADQLDTLRTRKVAAMGTPEAERLGVEIAALEKKTQAAAVRFVQAQRASQGVGATKGDIRQLAVEFGVGSKAAQGTEQAMRRVAAETKGAAGEAAGLAAEFQAARAGAQSTLASLKGEVAGLLARLSTDLSLEERDRLKGIYEAKVKEARKTAQALIDGDRFLRQAEDAIGVQSLQELERREKERQDKIKRANEERRRLLRDRLDFEADLRRQAQEAAVASLDDEFTRELAALEVRRRDIDRLRTDTRGLTPEQIQENQQKAEIEERELAATRTKLIKKFRGEGAVEILSLQAKIDQQQIEADRAAAAQITSHALSAIADRAALVRSAEEREGQAKLNQILAANEAVQAASQASTKQAADAEIAAREAVARARVDLMLESERQSKLKGQISDADRARLAALEQVAADAEKAASKARNSLSVSIEQFRSQILAALQTPSTEERVRLLAGLGFPDIEADGTISEQGQRILTALMGELSRVNRETTASLTDLTQKADLEVADKLSDLRLAGITDAAERERVARLGELEKTHDAELNAIDAQLADIQEAVSRGLVNTSQASAIIDGLLDQRIAVDRRYFAQRFVTESDYYAQFNELARAAVAIETAFRTFGAQQVGDAERKALEEKLALLEREEDQLDQNYRDGLIRTDQYLQRVQAIADEERAIHAQLQRDKFDLEVQTLLSIQAAAQDIEAQKAADVEALQARLVEMSQAGQAFSAEAGRAQLELLRDFGLQSAAQMIQTTANVLLEGGNALEALKQEALRAIFDLAKKQVTILAPSIIALFQSFIPPPFGLIAGSAAVAALHFSLGAVEALAFKADGGPVAPYLPSSAGDVVPAMLTPGEFVLRADTYKKEREMIEWLHAGRSSQDLLFKKYAHLFVDDDGRLMLGRVPERLDRQDRMIADLGARIEAGLQRIVDGQEYVAARFASHQNTEVSGTLRADGRDLVAVIQEYTLLNRYR